MQVKELGDGGRFACVAASLITAAVPGPTTFIERGGCATESDNHTNLFEELDDEAVSERNATDEDAATSFMTMYQTAPRVVWAKMPLPAELLKNQRDKSEEVARLVLAQRRAFNL